MPRNTGNLTANRALSMPGTLNCKRLNRSDPSLVPDRWYKEMTYHSMKPTGMNPIGRMSGKEVELLMSPVSQ